MTVASTGSQQGQTSLERVTKSPLGRRMICAFTNNSIRQIGLGVGDKLVNCVGKVVGLNIIDMRLY